ncbi:MAG: hypothetical protein KC419_07395 [Anaerolineales bacterium]|nr:hypothetical protein [Anaerolineales bacterium]
MVALKPLPGVKSKLVMAGNVELATAVFTVRAAVEMPFADVSGGVIAVVEGAGNGITARKVVSRCKYYNCFRFIVN